MALKLIDHSRRNTRFIVWIYTITIVVMLAGMLISLARNWIDRVKTTEETLLHNASMVSGMLDASLKDALKLLEITRRDLQEATFEHSRDARNAREIMIHRLLRNSVSQFSQYKRDDVFGRLFYMNKTGKIVAQSADSPLPDINVSDRRYFKEIQNNPALKFAIGNLVTARVTGVAVFHMAVPLRDHQGKFIGVLAQQINVDDLSNLINLTYSDKSGMFMSLLPDGQVVFVYPGSHDASSEPDLPSGQILLEQINGLNLQRACLRTGNGFGSTVSAYMKSPSFGLTTVVSVPMASIISSYLSDQAYLLIYSAVAVVVVSVLFWLFYNKSIAFHLMQERSIHDALTGLYNRRGLDEALPDLMRQSQRNKEPVSVLFIDIDYFKHLNDQFGHESGDQVLICLSRLLENQLNRPLDFLCRWGGEEFVMVLPSTTEAGAIHVGQRILDAVRNMPTGLGAPLEQNITVSIGLASMVVDQFNAKDDIIDQADKAMFQAKNSGRNCLIVFSCENQNA
jgi:diguanylate cyclase (GGDEF)-like protein